MRTLTIAPIPKCISIPDQRVSFGQGVSLVERPSWLNEGFARLLGDSDRRKIAESPAILEVDHSLIEEAYPRIVADDAGERAVQILHLIVLSVWIAKPSQFGFEFTFDVNLTSEGAEAMWFRFQRRNPFVGRREPVSGEDLRRAVAFFHVLVDMERSGALWAAMRMLNSALRVGEWEIRYMMLWIVLEALFGPDDPGESTHKLAERVAAFLERRCEEGGSKRAEVYRDVKKLYGYRSKIVHGKLIHNARVTPEASLRLMEMLESLAQRSLLKVFESEGLVDVFSGSKREGYMLDLVLNG